MLRAEGIEMLPFPVSLPSHPPFFPSVTTNPFLFPTTSTATSPSPPTPRLFLSTHGYNRSSLSSSSSSSSSSHNTDSPFLAADGDATDDDSSGTGNPLFDSDSESSSADGFQIHIQKLSHNSRRIRATIPIDAGLPTIWSILTDYERLPDFIPGLALSQLIEKRDNFARLFQIGQQNLAFGLKFNAKGIVDCYEKGLENLPFGQRRDIEFKMIEGDFQTFEGRWSIEEYNNGRCEGSDSLLGQEFHTTLLYVVDVEPKLWLPVLLVEGRLCREIKMNLSCIREEAQKAIQNSRPSH